MSIYSSTHPGVTNLDTITLTNLRLQESHLRGYFSKEALRKLLKDNPSSAGIRFYNVNPSIDFPSLLAVCVMENGADLQDNDDDNPDPVTHLLCNPINVSSNSPQEVSRFTAHEMIKKGYSFDVIESEKFSSYFSRTMLGNLFEGNNHEGIAFYKVLWLTGHSTHLAVSSDLVDPDPESDARTPIVGINSAAFDHCLSDQPCPGHCVKMNMDNNEELSPTPMASAPNDLQSHYIPIWD